MDRDELVRVLTLWFAVLIFIQTAPGSSDSQLLEAIGLFALSLMLILPLWIVVELVSDLLGWTERTSVEE